MLAFPKVKLYKLGISLHSKAATKAVSLKGLNGPLTLHL